MKMVIERHTLHLLWVDTDNKARGGLFRGIWELHVLLALIDKSFTALAGVIRTKRLLSKWSFSRDPSWQPKLERHLITLKSEARVVFQASQVPGTMIFHPSLHFSGRVERCEWSLWTSVWGWTVGVRKCTQGSFFHPSPPLLTTKGLQVSPTLRKPSTHKSHQWKLIN